MSGKNITPKMKFAEMTLINGQGHKLNTARGRVQIIVMHRIFNSLNHIIL